MPGTATPARPPSHTRIFNYWAKAYKDLFSASKFSRFISYERARIDIQSVGEQDMAWRALEEAIARLEKRLGKSQVPWGEINVVVRSGVFPVDSTNTFGVLHPDEGPEQEDGRIFCNDGWAHLMLVIESEAKRIWSLLPYGESEQSSSAHDNDQAKLHSARKLKRFWFTPSEILGPMPSLFGVIRTASSCCSSKC